MDAFAPLTLPVTLRPRRGPVLRGTLLMLFLGAGSWWVAGQSAGVTAGLLYACAVFLLLMGALVLWGLLSGRAGLALTATGFRVTGLFGSLAVPWTDVAEFGLGDVGTKALLLWRYRPERAAAYNAGWLTRLSQTAVQGWDGNAHVSTFPVEPAALAAFMQTLADQHTGTGVGA